MKRTFVLSVCLLALVACGRRSQPAESAHAEPPRAFVPVEIPVSIASEVRLDYLRDHYWDRFDFADTLFVREADTLQSVEAFARFAVLLAATPERPADVAPMRTLVRRAAVSRPMLDYFAMLAEAVLHDPNSPLRDDELYIPVLEAQLASPWYDEYERISPEYELRMALRNRPGERAADFRYTLASGAAGTLHGIEAEYVLLLISNPGCPMCREVREAIQASPMFSEMIERGRLKVLSFYPDEDLAAWREHLGEVPATWIDGYDAAGRVREEDLYDLRAIPSLYLLDADKRVLLKDATSIELIEEVIDRRG